MPGRFSPSGDNRITSQPILIKDNTSGDYRHQLKPPILKSSESSSSLATGLPHVLEKEIKPEPKVNKANGSSGKGDGAPKSKKKRAARVTANLAGTRYEVVKSVAHHMGFRVTKDEDPTAYLIWYDSFVSTDRIADLKPYQRINHFPGMGEICRKDCLARNMNKMARAMPEEFNFVPKTWILPGEMPQLQAYYKEIKRKKKTRMFISKPANGAMGNGISLFKNPERLPSIQEPVIVQEYLDKPFLVDGYKCDMRIYVLVTSCDPLRIFLYNDGLLRMSTEKYTNPTDSNMDNIYMHLTNYSVNKHNDNYVKGDSYESGSKRSLKYFNEYLHRNEYDIQFLWRNITDIIVKTLLVSLPHVLHAYRMCRPGQPPGSDSVSFEILGFDVMLDRKLRPWLLEINRSPSFGTDEDLDREVKTGLLEDTFRLLNIKLSDKRRNQTQQKYLAQRRLLRQQMKSDNDDRRTGADNLKRKEELKELLLRVRRDSVREDFENRNCNRFKRIFPSDDKFKRERYSKIIMEAFTVFLAGRASSLQKELEHVYVKALKEEEILDMLAMYEADEVAGNNKGRRGPKPLTSMPVREPRPPAIDIDSAEDLEDEDEDSASEDEGTHKSLLSTRVNYPRRSVSRTSDSAGSRPTSSSSLHRSARGDGSSTSVKDEMTPEQMAELNIKTLEALNDMRIKFPGKSDDEAELILDRLNENWKFHKPRIASYWLVKLDSIKRRKVIDIVRSNVRAVLTRTWKVTDVDSLHIYRVFNRVFNRLLWSHGQGLWNCFQNIGTPWEVIFSKSSEVVNDTEMACCQRVVQLCRDCLLIVYQFAAEAKTQSSISAASVEGQVGGTGALPRPPSGSRTDRPAYVPQTMSNKLSRLYHKSQSLNTLPMS